jgi:hypothetical protein
LRVRRRLFTILSAVSLLLSIALIVQRLRPLPGAVTVPMPQPPSDYMVTDSNGVTSFNYHVSATSIQNRSSPRIFGIAIPFPAALALTIVLPMVWWLAWWQRRTAEQRRRSCRCLTCGYDLRATPERCPECGAVPVGATK